MKYECTYVCTSLVFVNTFLFPNNITRENFIKTTVRGGEWLLFYVQFKIETFSRFSRTRLETLCKIKIWALTIFNFD